ncbi:aspartyl-phosphate phosphatase Spo0E family protein [Bacillus sp. 31A1R]|uniref:Aspartyl-phosphate phosphatase Spo0E family protein n=1 Tax=Robertmurraya mangrovi TaxID=3098077 RepID=A0ABU5J3D5_9BACI|nr:aspartyl-phosphate phosphatase Spo0E family protein [Bacillus sp. 31A1R]MDZ5473913.1 aspartyl-phosphate phosphatase Spo0E family protein [Bacillus sp. 31A1R]
MLLRTMIEETRRDMLNIAELKGQTSPFTVLTSQKLDHLLNLYQKKYGLTDEFYKMELLDLKVNGSLISNIIQGSLEFDSSLNKLINEYQLNRKDPFEWYSLEEFQTIFSYLEENYDPNIFTNIGRYVPINCIFPENIDSFEKGLFNLNTAYHLNHTSKKAGFYEVIFDGRNEFQVICHTPFYPYAFNYGILKGLAEKYRVEVQITVVSFIKGGEFRVIMDK